MCIPKTIKGNLTKDYFKTYYQRNKDKMKNNAAEYYYDNRNQILEHRKKIKRYIYEYQKKYYQEHKDKRKAITDRWYQNNKEKVALKNKKYYQNVTKLKTKKYTEYLKQYQKDYYIQNLDKIKQRQKDYYNKIKERKEKKIKKKKKKKTIKNTITPTYNYADDGMVILSFS